MTDNEEELKSLLMRVKAETENTGLKFSIQKPNIMASGPITSWQIDGKTMETVTDFIFLGSKTTADSDCSREIKRCLFLGRKAMTNLDSIFKSRDITLLIKGKAMIFPEALYRCESWNMKAERRRTDGFKLGCWRRLLRVPWTARRSNQSISPKGNQPWIFIGRAKAEAEATILWLPDAKSQLWKRPWC